MTVTPQQPSYTRRQWRLIDAGMRLLDRVGISDFTMRSLADEIGLSPMAAYKHFENQRALQLELWRTCQVDFYDALLAATSDASDPATAFLVLCRRFVEYSMEHPFRYELLYNHPFVREVQRIPDLDELRHSVWLFAHDLLRRAVDAGFFRADIPSELLLVAAISQVRGLSSLLIYSRGLGGVEVSDAESIESGLKFIREALISR